MVNLADFRDLGGVVVVGEVSQDVALDHQAAADHLAADDFNGQLHRVLFFHLPVPESRDGKGKLEAGDRPRRQRRGGDRRQRVDPRQHQGLPEALIPAQPLPNHQK